MHTFLTNKGMVEHKVGKENGQFYYAPCGVAESKLLATIDPKPFSLSNKDKLPLCNKLPLCKRCFPPDKA